MTNIDIYITFMDNFITISERLTKIRNNARLTQSEFSKKIGVKQSYYSELERGKREITTKVIEALIKNFNVSSDWLLSNTGEMYSNKNITNVDIEQNIIEANQPFINDYFFGGLNTDNYEYKQIIYYEGFSVNKLLRLKSLELDSFKTVYMNTKKLSDFIRFLAPSASIVIEKFAPLPEFEEYLKKTDEERKEMMNEAGKLNDSKLKVILQIIQYKEEKEHWDRMLTISIDYLDIYKKSLKTRINNPHFRDIEE